MAKEKKERMLIKVVLDQQDPDDKIAYEYFSPMPAAGIRGWEAKKMIIDFIKNRRWEVTTNVVEHE